MNAAPPWVQGILNRFDDVERTGDGWKSFCKSHLDRNKRSLSWNIGKDGRLLVNCFTGCTADQIMVAVQLTTKDLFAPGSQNGSRGPEGCTLADYARAKNIPVDFLESLGAADTDWFGRPAVKIPYWDEQRSNPAIRFRVALKSSSDAFRWQKGATVRLYGLDRLQEMWARGYAILVEGESDAQTLWFHDEPALGIPGATNWRETRDASKVDGFKRIFVVIEGDLGGSAVENWLMTSRIRDRVSTIGLGELKDPSGLYLDDPERFLERWSQALESAMPWAEHAREIADRSAAKVDRGMVTKVLPVDGKTRLILEADLMTRKSTGIHGRLTTSYQTGAVNGSSPATAADTTYLRHTWPNFDRDPDRLRFANAVHKKLKWMLGDKSFSLAAEKMQHELDVFCYEAWPAFNSRMKPEVGHGDSANNAVNFLAEPYVAEDMSHFLFGEAGSGKSWTALLLAVSINSGSNAIWNTQTAKVLYVNLERSRSSMLSRLEGVNICAGLAPDAGLLFLHGKGGSLVDIHDHIRDAVNNDGVEMVFLDSLSRAGAGDLNENHTANEIIDRLSNLVPTWLAIAHSPRGDNSHIFGSSMYDNAADAVLRLTSEKEDQRGTRRGVLLELLKENDLKPTPPSMYVYEYDHWGIKSVTGADPADFPTLAEAAPKSKDQLLREFVSGEPNARTTTTEAAKKTGLNPTFVSRQFTKSGDYVLVNKDSHSKWYALKA